MAGLLVNPFKVLLDCRGFFRKELGQPSLAAEHPSAEEGQQEDSMLPVCAIFLPSLQELSPCLSL